MKWYFNKKILTRLSSSLPNKRTFPECKGRNCTQDHFEFSWEIKVLMLMRAFLWKWAHYCSFSSAFNLFFKCVSSWKLSKGRSWICNKSKVKKKSLALMKSIVMLQSWRWKFNYWREESRDGPQIKELSWGINVTLYKGREKQKLRNYRYYICEMKYMTTKNRVKILNMHNFLIIA